MPIAHDEGCVSMTGSLGPWNVPADHLTLQKLLNQAVWSRAIFLPLAVAAIVCAFVFHLGYLGINMMYGLVTYLVLDYRMLRAGYSASRVPLEPGERILDEYFVVRRRLFAATTLLRMTNRRFLIGVSSCPQSIDLGDVAELIPTTWVGRTRGLNIVLAPSGEVLKYAMARRYRDQLVADFNVLRA